MQKHLHREFPKLVKLFLDLVFPLQSTVHKRYDDIHFRRMACEDSDCCYCTAIVATENNIVMVKCLNKEDPRSTENAMKDCWNHPQVRLVGSSALTWDYGSVHPTVTEEQKSGKVELCRHMFENLTEAGQIG